MSIGTEVLVHLAATTIHDALAKLGKLKYRTILRRVRIRVSTSALLQVADERGRFLLIANARRPGLAPIGGVHKRSVAAPKLEALGFTPEGAPVDDIVGKATLDVRGFIRGRDLSDFVTWFSEGVEREPDTECLRREYAEELPEAGVAATAQPALPGLVLERRILEPPASAAGATYLQMRIASVYRIADATAERAFCKAATRLIALGMKAQFVTAKQIAERRTRNGTGILPHSQYLFSTDPAESGIPFIVE